MNVDQVTINTADSMGQQGLQANNGQDVTGQANNQPNGGKAAPDDLVTITKPANLQADKLSKPQANSAKAISNPSVFGGKGVITLDDDKNVVVRFFDNNGKVVAQYPPEDYIKIMRALNQSAESLFHKKA